VVCVATDELKAFAEEVTFLRSRSVTGTTATHRKSRPSLETQGGREIGDGTGFKRGGEKGDGEE
jgi:hypothetical protein